jgi:hypothetical protein
MRSEWACESCGASFVRPGGTPYTYCSNACQLVGIKNRNRRSLEERFWSKVQRGEGCWLWTGATVGKDGEKRGVFNRGHGRTVGRAYRVAWELTNGPIPDGAWVLHGCDNGLCVRPDHLHLGDVATNAREMVERGRSARGERHSQTRLTDDTVRAMRARFDAGARILDVALEFGVNYRTTQYILNRINYRYVA